STLPYALAAGAIAGLAEWFRTGNLLLFAVPCAVYSAATLRQSAWRGCGLAAGAFVGWVGMAALRGIAVPSPVNKNVANLWACCDHLGGPTVTEELGDGNQLVYPMLHYALVPGTAEIYIDSVIRQSCGKSTLEYVQEHADEISKAYVHGLKQAWTSCF